MKSAKKLSLIVKMKQCRNKAIALLLCFALFLSLVPSSITVWGGEPSNSQNETDVICFGSVVYVDSADGLIEIANNVNSGINDYDGCVIVLTADIDLKSNEFIPIGLYQSAPFRGSFDGNHHTIDGLYLSEQSFDSCSGLFGYVYSKGSYFQNVILKGTIDSCSNIAGGMIAYLYVEPNGTFSANNIASYCNMNPCRSIFCQQTRAGICGYVKSCGNCKIEMSNCNNYGNIQGYSFADTCNLGGIVASIEAETSDIYNFYRCVSSSSLCATRSNGYSEENVGGLFGYASGGIFNIEQCYVCGNIQCAAYYTNIGGLIGKIVPCSLLITNSLVDATIVSEGVQSDSSAGGFIGGWANDYYSSSNSSWIIENCLVLANISTANAAGFVKCGFNTSSSSLSRIKIKNSYFDSTILCIDSDNLKSWMGILQGGNNKVTTNIEQSAGYPSNSLKNSSTLYLAWDFISTWSFGENGYPTLTYLDTTLDGAQIKKVTPKKEDGFNFYLNCSSNFISTGSTIEMQVGYYKNNSLDLAAKKYIYTVSNSRVISVSDSGWSNEHGQKLKIAAKEVGSSTITVTNPVTSESSSLEIYVTASESGWNFYNIPKTTIEAGKTTNFYNYSGMVVNEFSYDEHKNATGKTDYYTVSMTIYNSANLYGVVTSYNADGSIYSYRVLDKMDSHDSSFVGSLQSLYYSCGDLYYLIKNKQYYSGKSISTENEINIDVPVGGHLSISNNPLASDLVCLVNFVYLTIDFAAVFKSASGWVKAGTDVDDFGGKIDKGIRDRVVNRYVASVLSENEVKLDNKKYFKFLKSSVLKEFKELNLNSDNLTAVFLNVNNTLQEIGVNIFSELEKVLSASGIASIVESITTNVLPTGWIIDGLYTFSSICDFAVFANAFSNSLQRPEGIYIYAPSDPSKYHSNGITVDTQRESGEAVVHAYTVVDAGNAGVRESTFADDATYYSEKYQTYSITLYKNGTETQPESTVTVRIPIPDNFNKLNRSALKVYRNNEDGSLTDMNARVEGDDMVFETDHFSYYSIVDESVPVMSENLKFYSASLTLQSNLTVNYKVDKSQFDANGYANPYIKFTMNGKETVVTAYEVLDDKYVFGFSNIAPHLAGDTIQATLYAEKDGTAYYSETRNYSIAEYCYNMLEKYSTDEYTSFRTLLVDLLNYCAASQKYMSYKTDLLVNSALTGEQLSWETIDSPALNTVFSREYIVIDSPSVSWVAAGLNLQNSVTMRFKLTTDDIEDLSVRVATDSGQEWIIYSDAFEPTDGGYYVYFDGLNVGEMREPVYVTAYDINKVVSNTIRYSVESYAYSKQDDDCLTDLLLAMMKYGDSAFKYAN